MWKGWHMESMMKWLPRLRWLSPLFLVVVALASLAVVPVFAEPLIIAAAPSVKAPIEVIAQAFERTHPGIEVRIHYDNGLGLRQTIAAMQNSGRYFIGSGPF